MFLWMLTLSARSSPCPPETAPKQPPTSLREVDWCNRDYHTVFGPLRAGRTEYHEWELDMSAHSTTISSLVAVLYPKETEAVVVLSEETWLPGGGTFGGGEILWFIWRDGAPVEVARGRTGQSRQALLDGEHVVLTLPTASEAARYVRKGDRIVPAAKTP